MSDNKLLAENTVRRFMKLANVDSLTDTFIQETYASKMKDEKDKETQKEEAENTEEVVEESEEEIDINEEEELELNEEEIDEMMGSSYKDEDAEMEDPGGEGLEGEEPGKADLSLSEEEAQVIIDLGKRLEEAMGDEMVAGDDMGELDPGEDMGGEEMAAADEPEGEEEDDELGMMAEEKDAIVQEVLKRVAKRLVSEKVNRS